MRFDFGKWFADEVVGGPSRCESTARIPACAAGERGDASAPQLLVQITASSAGEPHTQAATMAAGTKYIKVDDDIGLSPACAHMLVSCDDSGGTAEPAPASGDLGRSTKW